jgi:ribosome maturation factor RimP
MLEKKIYEIIADTVEMFGCNVVKVNFGGEKSKVLQVFLERTDLSPVKIEDCRLISKNISALLDVEDIIDGKYYLEVSSIGAERPLFTIDDYKKFTGRNIKMRLSPPVNEVRSYIGLIHGVFEDNILIKIENSETVVTIPFENVSKANLMLSLPKVKKKFNKKQK